MNCILPNPFNLSVYGQDNGLVYKDIISVKGANNNAAMHFPSSLICENCKVLDPVTWQDYNLDLTNTDNHNPYAINMQENACRSIEDLESFEKLFVIGGDHTISIGTGAGISKHFDMSKIGLVWVDAHADYNIPEISDSKSLTGYPCAIVQGHGDKEFTELFDNNFINKSVHIGLRDVDNLESLHLKKRNCKTFSMFDIDTMGLNKVLNLTSIYLRDCKYIWLSIDIDSLDNIYVDKGRTDVPVTGGLTPRELLLITHYFKNTGKLKIGELVQINNSKNNGNLVTLGSRIIEQFFDLGGFRFNQ